MSPWQNLQRQFAAQHPGVLVHPDRIDIPELRASLFPRTPHDSEIRGTIVSADGSRWWTVQGKSLDAVLNLLRDRSEKQ